MEEKMIAEQISEQALFSEISDVSKVYFRHDIFQSFTRSTDDY